ncbi:hypothetical protein HBI42_207940 [Parastagonospora nodorum]|nr:hypothetical protein HBI43_237150 [Parastagonospora nodorum]KAH6244120.1 hypothetical protein HBI42_207940 [Parastagonospora nodorum]
MRFYASIIAALTLSTVHALCDTKRPLTTVYARATVVGSDSAGGDTPYAYTNGYGTVVCNPGQKATSTTRRGPYYIGDAEVCSTTYQCCSKD